MGSALCRFGALYKSPNQTQYDFLSFTQNFELTLAKLSENNPYLLVATGDFINAKLRHQYSRDTNSFEGISIDNVASQFGLHQIIKEPLHIPENSSSYIDLVFTSLPTLIVDSGTHHAVYPNCHQIFCSKFNVQIHYSSPYTCEVWHYKDSNDDLIRRAINQFNWERASENKNVDENVLIFNKIIWNILSKLYVIIRGLSLR